MRKIQYKICRKCKKMYHIESGGIVMMPQDHIDMGLCEICRRKEVIGILRKIIGSKQT